MTRIALITAALLVALAAGSVGALAWADGSAAGKLAAGTRVGGVDVGGLTQRGGASRARRDRVVGDRAADARRARREALHADRRRGRRAASTSRTAVKRAYVESREGSFLSRGWRKITGAKLDQNVPVKAVADRLAVRRFVEGIAQGAGPQAGQGRAEHHADERLRSAAASPVAASPPATRSSRASCAG